MHFIRVQKKALDADAKKIEQFKPYNILPLESPGVNNPFLSFPEVRLSEVSCFPYHVDLKLVVVHGTSHSPPCALPFLRKKYIYLSYIY